MLGKLELLLNIKWTGRRRFAVWSICALLVVLLFAFRVATDAEFAFASIALFAVLAIGWIEGKKGGLLAAVLAAAMWDLGDYFAGREFSSDWIPWANAATRILTYGVVAILVAELRQQLAREYERARHDVLTGLLNRRAFVEAGTAEAARARRYHHPLAVAFLDLDNFKQLNDSRGHQTGDDALRAAALAASEALRNSDIVARLGGDEFAILLPETGFAAAQEVGEKLSKAVNGALSIFSPVACSIGVACFETSDRQISEMLQAADELMYEVKTNCKGSVLVAAVSALPEGQARS